MFWIDGRLLAGAVVALFLVGTGLGYVVATDAGPLDSPGADGSGPSTPTEAPAETTATPTATTGPVGPTTTSGPVTTTRTPTGTTTATPQATGTPTRTPTATPTAAPTATPSPTATPPETSVPTPTPIPPREFDVAAIERELRRLLNDWRTDRGLGAFTHEDGHLVADLDEMASGHSRRMAAVGATIHEIDNRSSADRYRDADLYHVCKFQTDPQGYMLMPEKNRFEVLAKTTAGTVHEGPDGTTFNKDEAAVARAVFENWRSDAVFGDRLLYRNANRIGIGVEITDENEVFVTGNVCGV